MLSDEQVMMKRLVTKVGKTWLILLVPVLIGMTALVFSTQQGPGVGGDATIYITSARNLLLGKGLGLITASGEFRLIPYFPPLFPLALSFLGLLGIELVSAAHWMNIALLGAFVWLAGWTVRRASHSNLLALTAASLLALSPVLINVYSWAMSEPLAIFWGFCGLFFLWEYLQKLNGRYWFVLSALAGGLAVITRYSMVAFIGAGALGLLFLSGESLKTRLVRIGFYLAVALMPLAVWVWIDLSHTSTLSSRSILSATEMVERFIEFWPRFEEVLLFWLIPDSWIVAPRFYPAVLNHWLVPVAGLLLVVWIASLSWKLRRTQAVSRLSKQIQLAVLLGFAALAYLIVTLLVYVTTYPPITIGSRMYSPMQAVFLVLFVLLVGLTMSLWRNPVWVRWALTIVLLFCVVWYGWRTFRIVQQNYGQGMGFTSVYWQESETVQAVKQLPPEIKIVTNEEMALLFLTGRTSYPLAEIYFQKPLTVFYRYGDGDLTKDEAQRVFREEGAVLVLFDSISDQMSLLYGKDAAERIAKLVEGLEMLFHGNDGAIYVYPKLR